MLLDIVYSPNEKGVLEGGRGTHIRMTGMLVSLSGANPGFFRTNLP